MVCPCGDFRSMMVENSLKVALVMNNSETERTGKEKAFYSHSRFFTIHRLEPGMRYYRMRNCGKHRGHGL